MRVGDLLGDLDVAVDDQRAGLALLDLDRGVGQRRGGQAADEPTPELLLVAGVLAGDPAALLGAAVVIAGDDVLGDVDQAPGQVARVGRPEGGVGEALAGAVGGDEVLEDRHPLPEVAPDGDVDDPARRVGHQAAHRAELADVALVPAGAGRGHHRDRPVRLEALHHLVGQLAGRLLPDVDDLLVALVLGDEAALELAVDLGDVLVRRLEPLALVLGDLDVPQADRHPAAGREVEADALDAVGEMRGLVSAEHPVALVDELLELAPDHDLVGIAELVGQDLVEEDPADGRPAPLGPQGAELGVPRPDLGVDRLVEREAGLLLELVGQDRLVLGREDPDALGLLAERVHRQVVAAEDHVLGRRDRPG